MKFGSFKTFRYTPNSTLSWLYLYTVGENIIATTKKQNNYVAFQSFIFQYCDSNIGLFSIAPCKVILILFFASFLLTLFLKLSLLKAIAKRLPLLFANAFKSVKERQLLLSQ